MKEIISVNPFRCRMWTLHDRIDNYVTEDSCRAEIGSFEKHGQLVCTLGRKLQDEPDFDVELICGARRLFVARHLNVPLLVELTDMSDKDAMVAMDIENRHRRDLSPYERGRSYARWLRTGAFRSQDELARALKISAPQVSRLLRVAQLPAVVVSAFPSPTQICEGWGLQLMDALEQPERRRRTVERARLISVRPEKPGAEEVFHELLSACAPGKRIQSRSHDRVVKCPMRGAPLFRVRQLRGSIAVVLPLASVSAESFESICASITHILSDSGRKAAAAV